MPCMFELVSSFKPAGDQPEAIENLANSIFAGNRHQTLVGVTGSGKTFTIANVISRLNRPVLVISHNKTLAAQLYAEFKSFFPNNAVEYFVSYFDYYQPEAYIPQTDTYIEKDSSINDEIERLRLSTMSSLFARRDVIVVASVSCIYGIGSKDDYEAMLIHLEVGQEIARNEFLSKLVDLQYERNDVEFDRSQFRVRGDTVEVRPAYREDGLRIEFFGDEIDRITRFDPLTGRTFEHLEFITIYPSKQFVTPAGKIKDAISSIREELDERVAWFEKHNKLLEAQRLKMRTEYDIEIMLEMGYCSGIENYSRHISGRPPGSRPCTLIDFFPEDFITVLDESHVTVPQIGAMYEGDRSRKQVLVDHGFRLPSALDNRPLKFGEFRELQGQTIYMSATPSATELSWSRPNVFEQIVRPTGLVDPKTTIKPLKNQIDDLIEEARRRAGNGERILVTTLTKRTAEELTDYLREIGVNVRYLHSEINAIDRVEILRALRRGDFDVLVGINLLREGLDLPEVSLVAILDADKEGFLRSTTSLIQTAGRAARHLNGEVILYADVITSSIKSFLDTSDYRRGKQLEFNREHNITPQAVIRAMEDRLSYQKDQTATAESVVRETEGDFDITQTLRELQDEMFEASNNLEFEKAALLRDQIQELKSRAGIDTAAAEAEPVKYTSPRKQTKKRKRAKKKIRTN
ncbi:MAG: excinuclease ABC subunit UvrB [Verrucomicrobia bacterium]|nr:excinuclease ABC subunit UvrB [Verrucomicrobiota bacterium]MCF7708079.1 excinuclease ABC subunit UvrB [Verrucomicrobiota bacterium]